MDQGNIGATIAGQLGEVETAHMIARQAIGIDQAPGFGGGSDGR
jgi:hypothetical protein